LGYRCYPYLLNASHFGVPQKRERVFFVGFLDKPVEQPTMITRLQKHKRPLCTVRQTVAHLGPAGTDKNPLTCGAKITLAETPVMRRSPYAGMIFNGLGRPLNVDDACATLPASMGGNKTPIVDEVLLYGDSTDDWVVNYHSQIMRGEIKPQFGLAPSRLRRLTVKEAALLQTFPENYRFCGSKSSVYRQIGNAVPCKLAEAVAKAVVEELATPFFDNETIGQLSLAL
jgi:DNA (cytosine-5)-methyltransferase 1